MKKLILVSLMLLGFSKLQAQSEESSCYSQWAKAFEIRGADDVKNGWHEGIVVSIRSGSRTKCYTGKVQVTDGVITHIDLKFVGGKWEAYNPEWKYPDQKGNIINGISRTLQTKEDDLVNIIFINHLKPKKQAYELAPLPNLDDF